MQHIFQRIYTTAGSWKADLISPSSSEGGHTTKTTA